MALATQNAPTATARRLVIEPRRGWVGVDWRELADARELLLVLIWRDIIVRYKQTVLGIAWALLQPLFQMLIFTLIFGKLAKLGPAGVPYALFVCLGILPWTFFNNAVTLGGQSLVNQQHLLTKIYFPRLFIPTACVGSGLLDFAIASLASSLVFFYYEVAPSWTAVLAIPLLVPLLLATLGLTYFLAALTVTYRDFRYVIPFFVQLLFFFTPVVYSVADAARFIPESYAGVLALNPMFGIVDAFRAALLGTPVDWQVLGISSGVACCLFFFGLYYFRKTEYRFADIA